MAAGRASALSAGQRLASAAHDGAVGCDRSTMPASAGVRSPLALLQPRQAATVLVQVFLPPRERGRDVVDGGGRAGAVPAPLPVAGQYTPGRDQAGPFAYRQRVTTYR